MPLLIDEPRWPAHGRLWSHLVSDTSFAELHAFADLLGLPPRSFEGDHYDVPAERYAAVVGAGARPVSMREVVLALQVSGLRRPKRKGERVLASTLLPPDGDPAAPARRDLLASPLPAPVTPVRVDVLVFAASEGTHARPALLLVGDGAGPEAGSLPWAALGPSEGHVDEAAADAVRQHTGVRLDAGALRICGHTRTLGAEPTWSTFLTATVATTAPWLAPAAAWAPTDLSPTAQAATEWWPLVDWILDRRQPRTSS